MPSHSCPVVSTPVIESFSALAGMARLLVVERDPCAVVHLVLAPRPQGPEHQPEDDDHAPDLPELLRPVVEVGHRHRSASYCFRSSVRTAVKSTMRPSTCR